MIFGANTQFFFVSNMFINLGIYASSEENNNPISLNHFTSMQGLVILKNLLNIRYNYLVTEPLNSNSEDNFTALSNLELQSVFVLKELITPIAIICLQASALNHLGLSSSMHYGAIGGLAALNLLESNDRNNLNNTPYNTKFTNTAFSENIDYVEEYLLEATYISPIEGYQ